MSHTPEALIEDLDDSITGASIGLTAGGSVVCTLASVESFTYDMQPLGWFFGAAAAALGVAAGVATKVELSNRG